jgi:hypothetical protein
MKKLVAILCIAGSTLALSACDSTGQGNVETAAPYASSRTAGGDVNAPAERVFQERQMK